MKMNGRVIFNIVLMFISACAGKYIIAANVYKSEKKESVLYIHPYSSRTLAEFNEQLPEVIFQCKYPTLCKIKKEVIEPHILESENEKPDDVHPRYLSFKFTGDYGDQSRSSKFKPEINIYHIAEFRQSLSKAATYVKEFDRQLQNLRQIINQKPSQINNELPFLPFIDAKKEFNVYVKYISFKNGKGIFYLTQFNSEPSIINNSGLTYIFQGITDNNEFYILATFPVKTKILPRDYDAKEYGSYKLPQQFYEPKALKQNELNYRNYIMKIGKELDRLTPNQFNPNLNQLQEILSTLEIKSEKYEQ